MGITLLTIFYYLSIIKTKQTICFSLFVGFFIGLYNKILMGVAIILSLAYFLDKKVSRKTINKNILYFFVACTLGGVILILAPGNYVRLDTISSGRYANVFGNIIYLIIEIITKPSDTAILLVLMFIFLILIFSNKNIPKTKSFIYGGAIICSIFVLTPVSKSYNLNQRVLLIYDAIFFIATMQQFYNHSSYIVNRLNHQLTKLSWLFLIYLAIQLSLMMSIYLMIYRFEEYRNTLVTYYQQNNVSEPVLPMLSEYSQIMFINDITLDENTYNNDAFAKFYDFDKVYGRELNQYI